MQWSFPDSTVDVSEETVVPGLESENKTKGQICCWTDDNIVDDELDGRLDWMIRNNTPT
jgi:hypothetical protein